MSTHFIHVHITLTTYTLLIHIFRTLQREQHHHLSVCEHHKMVFSRTRIYYDDDQPNFITSFFAEYLMHTFEFWWVFFLFGFWTFWFCYLLVDLLRYDIDLYAIFVGVPWRLVLFDMRVKCMQLGSGVWSTQKKFVNLIAWRENFDTTTTRRCVLNVKFCIYKISYLSGQNPSSHWRKIHFIWFFVDFCFYNQLFRCGLSAPNIT